MVVITPPRHPKSERLHEILKELGELHDRKQKDYGRDDDPFSNITASQDWGISPVVGVLLRMNDKVRRLQAFVRNGNLVNESAEDSMRDIAVYAIIALVELEQKDKPSIAQYLRPLDSSGLPTGVR